MTSFYLFRKKLCLVFFGAKAAPYHDLAIVNGRSWDNPCTCVSESPFRYISGTFETHGDETIVKWMGTSTGTRVDCSDHALGKGVCKRGAWERRLSYACTSI